MEGLRIRTRRGARLLLLLGLAVLAWQSVAFGLAVAGRRSNPAWAAKLAPDNSMVLASLAQDQLTRDPVAAGISARRALMRDPTSAAAAGALSMAEAQAGRTARLFKLLAYSEGLSRRDLQTHIWAIEVAVQRGDIRGALHHYDAALRVGRTMPNLLFPVLTAAAADPAIQSPLARMLRSGVPWGSSFLDYLSAQTTDIVAASRLINAIYAAGETIPRGPVNILVQRLMEVDDVERAWTLYARANPKAGRSALRNGTFDEVIESPTLFDWQLTDSGEARAEILDGERGGELRVEARPGSGGVVARQRLALPPGSYALAFDAVAADGATLGDSAFDLVCIPSRNRIAQARLADASGGRHREVRFLVPGGCGSQSLELTLDAGAEEGAVEGALDDVVVGAASMSRASLQ